MKKDTNLLDAQDVRAEAATALTPNATNGEKIKALRTAQGMSMAEQQFSSKCIRPAFCFCVAETIKICILESLTGCRMFPVEDSVPKFVGQCGSALLL